MHAVTGSPLRSWPFHAFLSCLQAIFPLIGGKLKGLGPLDLV